MSIAHYLEQFDLHAGQLAGSELPWLQQLRKTAIAGFAEKAFPSNKQEAWKYTNLELLDNIDFTVMTLSTIIDETKIAALLPVVSGSTYRAVFVDGHFSASLSSLQDVAAWISVNRWQDKSTSMALTAANDGLDALNLAFMTDSLRITIPAHMTLKQPIHIIYLYTDASTDKMMHFRHNIHLAEGARADIIEHHISDTPRYFSTAFVYAELAPHAHLHYHRWQDHSLAAYHISRLHLAQAQDSQATLFAFDIGGHFIRNDIVQLFQGEHSECHLHGLYLLQDKQHVDNHITLQHAQPRCYSRQFYKGIIDGRAHGIFHGKVIVHVDAQQTDANQHNANLLLSNNAEVDTQPQLEIYADDVKCSHGATVGQLDEDALFYLQSRGLDYVTARDLLIYGFAAEVLSHIEHAALQQFCQSRLLACLPKALTTLEDSVV